MLRNCVERTKFFRNPLKPTVLKVCLFEIYLCAETTSCNCYILKIVGIASIQCYSVFSMTHKLVTEIVNILKLFKTCDSL